MGLATRPASTMRAFPAAEQVDGLLLLGTGEENAGEVAGVLLTDLALGVGVGHGLLQVLPDRAVRIEVVLVLPEPADREPGLRRIRPASASRSPRSDRINVVLPAPFGPMTPIRSPGRMLIEKSSKRASPKPLVRCSPATRTSPDRGGSEGRDP